MASRVPGRIARLHADEGDVVQAGAPLVTMEDRESLAQVDQARAAVDAARARVSQAKAALALQIAQVDAQVAQAESGLDALRAREQQAVETQTLTAAQAALYVRQAESALAVALANSRAAQVNLDRTAGDLARAEALFKDGAVSSQHLDAARAAFTIAEAQHVASVD
ncbi:MAG: biotin/lipoyl-binding protein, partial [Burkholderiales bacterium]